MVIFKQHCFYFVGRKCNKENEIYDYNSINSQDTNNFEKQVETYYWFNISQGVAIHDQGILASFIATNKNSQRNVNLSLSL